MVEGEAARLPNHCPLYSSPGLCQALLQSRCLIDRKDTELEFEGTEAGLLLLDCRTWMPNQAPLGKKVHQEVYPLRGSF